MSAAMPHRRAALRRTLRDEYERFLAKTKGPDAVEARYGLANARLFQVDDLCEVIICN